MPAGLLSRVASSSAWGYTEQIDDEEPQDLHDSSDRSAVEPSEGQALQIFFLATGGRSWVRKNGWMRNRNVNVPHNRIHGLDGVTVGPRGRITFIQLRDNNLKMRAGAQDWSMLSGLRHLTVLDLSRNCLGGKIPDGLSALLALEDLNLHQNKLHGKIPAELGRLPHLKRLRLSNNHLSGYIPMEVENMATLELLDCSKNGLSGLLPAWACMGTVRAEVGDPQPSRMYLFIMDASPKSMRVVPASTRDEEARLRAEGWIQWHMAKRGVVGGRRTVEEQPPACRTYLGDTQVRLVAMPQHGRLRVKFDVKLNATASPVTSVFGHDIHGTVVGAVTADAALTSLDDFPHKVIEVKEVIGAVQSSRDQTPLSEQVTSREQDCEHGDVRVRIGRSSNATHTGGVEMSEFQQMASGADSSVDPPDVCGTSSPQAPVLMPAPPVSYILTSDDLFVEKWEEHVLRSDRCKNRCCSCVHKFIARPLLFISVIAAFFSLFLGFIFFPPMIFLTYAIGVAMCVYFVLVAGCRVAGVRSVPAKIALCVPWAFACYGVYWLARNIFSIMFGLGMFCFVGMAPSVIISLLKCCGVGPPSSTPTTSDPFPPQGGALPILTLAVEPNDRSPAALV